MSRYPGTQFRVFDNSQATASVPINNSTNMDDAVKYLATFSSVKGPEGITLSYGQDFYDRYGTQDNIKFNKYGQPLFQASMNINNGAALYAKRAVLDDATLGNATLAVVLTKYKDADVLPDSAVSHSEATINTSADVANLIGSISFANRADKFPKYSLSSMIFGMDNKKDFEIANRPVNEYKERYGMYKDFIVDSVANDNNTNPAFLNKANLTTKILSGFTQSIYYGENDSLIVDPEEHRSDVRKIRSITSGLFQGDQMTISSSFDAQTDIIDFVKDTGYHDVLNTNVYRVMTVNNTDYKPYTLVQFVPADPEDPTSQAHWEVVCTSASGTTRKDVTYRDIAQIPFNRYVTTLTQLNALIDPDWTEDVITEANPIYALVMGIAKPTSSSDHTVAAIYNVLVDESNNYSVITVDDKPVAIDPIDTTNYTDPVRLMNDAMVSKSGYVICEYVFPMFTIFDNGRGKSIKSIFIDFDMNTTMTLKKAIYTLSVYNYETSKRLEKFTFSLNPYARNNNTGYTFDIESAVNYKSKQISVKTYYESYDALLETLQLALETTDDALIENNDILFGHLANGNYPSFNSYSASAVLRKYTTVVDYAHLDVFSNETVTVNNYCDRDNVNSLTNPDIEYYYCNYTRSKQKLLQNLAMGSDGYCLDRAIPSNARTEVVPFFVIDLDDNSGTVNLDDLMLSGLAQGFVVSSPDADLSGVSSVTDSPRVATNFIRTAVTLYQVDKYIDGVQVQDQTPTYWLAYNELTKKRNDVFDIGQTPVGPGVQYKFKASNGAPIPSATPITIFIPYSLENLFQDQYARFFNGDFDRDIFNLDIYFPNAVFDANFSSKTKLAIQRLAAYRGDFMCYMDMGIGKVHSYEDCEAIIPNTLAGQALTPETSDYAYIREMHIAVTCLSYSMRNPYDNRVITVTGTYGLSNRYIDIFRKSVATVFAGISNGVTIDNIIEGTVSYLPKIYPTSEMTSLANIGDVYPSEDETIVNEKQKMCDLRVNYGCYYDDRFSIETEYTLHPVESEFSYWNNVALVCSMMQAIRKACPAARYKFITADDLSVYQEAVETAMKPWKNKFATLRFRYVADDTMLENKTYYAAIEVAFLQFAQSEIFTLTALNTSTLSSGVTSI